MKRQPTNREYVLGGLFALLAMFPMVTSVEMPTNLEGSVTQESLTRAFKDRESESTMRRMRWSVMRDCTKREANGEEGVCPDINDADAMIRYWTPVEHPATVQEDDAILASMSDLGDFEKHVLRRAQRVGQCPSGLDEFTPGFQALCEQTAAQRSERRDVIKEAVDQWMGAPRIGH